VKPYERTRAILSSGRPTGHKLLLIALADHLARSDDEQVYPSVDTLARLASMSSRTVQRSIRQMAGDCIEVHSVAGRSTRYRILWASLETPDTVLPPTQCHPRQDVTPDTVSPAPVMVSGAPDTVSPEVDQEVDQQVDQSIGQLALTQPPVSKPDEWEQLRDHLVSLGRKGAARLTRSRGDGLELAKLLKTHGLPRAQQLLTMAYTSQQDPHPFNRERGKGHPPLDTLRRHGAKYLERADEVEEDRQQVAASLPSWEQLCQWYDSGKPPGPERDRVRAMGWEVWCARLDPMMRHRHAQTYAQEAGA